MMSIANGNGYIFAGDSLLAWPAVPRSPAPRRPIRPGTGLDRRFPQPAPYGRPCTQIMTSSSSHAPAYGTAASGPVEQRGLPHPGAAHGMPKPGVQWDCLDIFAPLNQTGVAFTLEPTSLKYCGCCTLDTNTTLYAIDDERRLDMGCRCQLPAPATYALTRRRPLEQPPAASGCTRGSASPRLYPEPAPGHALGIHRLSCQEGPDPEEPG